MNFPLNPDLHCHSTTSDGTLTPEELAARAAANGVDLWALTDHDEVGGQQRAIEAARAHGIRYLTGVEISVTFADATVHIVGLGFDHTDPRLAEGLADTRDGRGPRAVEMGEQLAKVGIHGAYEGALKYVGNPKLISRTHFARFLVDSGVCRDTSEVFRKYLTEGKPGFVPHRWATLEQAVSWIVDAGGMAIIAHPARYGFTPQQEHTLFSTFRQLGGQGVEVVTCSHTPEEIQTYRQMALDFGLYASRGSDFHSPGESRLELGLLPPLPSGLTPVWQHLGHRIRMPEGAGAPVHSS